MVSQNPKKRKRRRGYHRGTYVSPVAGECKYRSGWEEKYMNYLDSNADVVSWSYENLVIQYVSNKSTGKLRKYYPDFLSPEQITAIDTLLQSVGIEPPVP